MRRRHYEMVGCLAFAILVSAADLSAVYPATLDWAEGAEAVEWSCEPSDVWALISFAYRFGDDFSLSAGSSNVVFGKQETNVVWAAVIPNEPGTIEKAPAGAGERITSFWLRFNPALIGDLFPESTVTGNGPEEMVRWGKRIYNNHINGAWQAGNQPVIPWKHSLVIDVQTQEGPRRFFMVDTTEATVKYEDFFRRRALPALVSTTVYEAQSAFDAVWEAYDREYAMFGIKPEVDWPALHDEYRPKLDAATNSYETGVVLADMLAHLEDLHVYVQVNGEYVPGYTRDRPLNASFRATPGIIGQIEDTKQQLLWGRTSDDIGYINVTGLGNKQLPDVFDKTLESLADTWALIVDLRYNGGGDELLGRAMAGRFADQTYVYSLNQYRNGPNQVDLGPKLERQFEPRGPWRYESPVIALGGQRTMSSAESFYLMLAQCPNVTTMGDRTAGSSANPRRIEAPGNITVNLPRWLDLLPNGAPLDKAGAPPDLPVEAAPDAFTNENDPVLQAALARLRELPESERLPGWRTSDTSNDEENGR